MGQFARFTRSQLQTIEMIVGRFMCDLPIKSKVLGHKHPLNSARDYLRPSNLEENALVRTAFEFIVDLVSDTTDVLIVKWYEAEHRRGRVLTWQRDLFGSAPVEEPSIVVDRHLELLLADLRSNGHDPAGVVVFVPFCAKIRGAGSSTHVAYGITKGIEEMSAIRILRDAAECIQGYVNDLKKAS